MKLTTIFWSLSRPTIASFLHKFKVSIFLLDFFSLNEPRNFDHFIEPDEIIFWTVKNLIVHIIIVQQKLLWFLRVIRNPNSINSSLSKHSSLSKRMLMFKLHTNRIICRVQAIMAIFKEVSTTIKVTITLNPVTTKTREGIIRIMKGMVTPKLDTIKIMVVLTKVWTQYERYEKHENNELNSF